MECWLWEGSQLETQQCHVNRYLLCWGKCQTQDTKFIRCDRDDERDILYLLLFYYITKIFSPVKLIIGLVCIKEKQFLYSVFKDWAVRIVFWIVWEWDKRKILQTIFVTPETIKYKTNSFLRAPGALQTSITNQSKLSNRKITLRLIRRVFQYFWVFCCISVRYSLVQSYLEVGGQALGWR